MWQSRVEIDHRVFFSCITTWSPFSGFSSSSLLFNQTLYQMVKPGWWTGFCFLSYQPSVLFNTRLFNTQVVQTAKHPQRPIPLLDDTSHDKYIHKGSIDIPDAYIANPHSKPCVLMCFFQSQLLMLHLGGGICKMKP